MKLNKLLLILIIFCSFCLGIGYASINSISLDIIGKSNAKSQDGIYITEVTSISGNNVLSNVSNNGTLLTSRIALENSNTSSKSIKVRLYNSTNNDYIFKDIVYTEEKYDNPDITFTFDKQGETISAGKSLDITITFKYATYDSDTLNVLNSLLNFKFYIPSYVAAEYDYTGNTQNFIVPHDGQYKLEVWGAQGGSYDTSYLGGNGGYSSGIINLKTDEILYIYVGGMGITTEISDKIAYGGYNGGGDSSLKKSTDKKYKNVSGGGATDIRLVNGDSENVTSLYSRIIVAGGGGGSLYYSSSRIGLGGAGGGLVGLDGTAKYNVKYLGTGGSQISGGTGYKESLHGGFGFGGDGDTSGDWNGAGGGGGWYGGAAGYSYQAGGGGGSGWVFTEENFNYWSLNNPLDSENYSVNSKYYLTDPYILSGIESFTDPDGLEVVGHSGNGYAKITYLGDDYN